MGLIVDSSVLITAEREGQNARQMLGAISGKAGNTEIAISVVTLIELATVPPEPIRRSEKRNGSSSSRNCSGPCPSIRSACRLLFVPGK